MIDGTTPHTGRALRDPAAVSREARRMVGLERRYHCDGCGGEHRSWARMSSCPDCGEAYVAAVIRRAAFA
ncbi:MAG: hypothetical protein QOI10_2118 [Solirubrobacterales bacterium]|jgi:hypothetical protein|nr:hypothetical protein [Solirubrobacterales bacterium]